MKKTLMALAILSPWVYAAPPQLTDVQKAYFKKQGLPIPGTGVTIVEPSRSAAINKALMEQKADGYRHEFSQAATNLLKIDELLKPEIKRVKTVIRQRQSTNITDDLSDVTMAYIFKPVPASEVKRFIAFAPTGVYVNDEKTEGWVGLTEYFESSFAPCSYEEVNVGITGGSSSVDRDLVSYDVNNKISEYMAIGDTTGYLYQIQWTDNIYRRKLRCATKTFDAGIRAKIIALANVIDA